MNPEAVLPSVRIVFVGLVVSGGGKVGDGVGGGGSDGIIGD